MSDEQFLADVEIEAANWEANGFIAKAAGIRHVGQMFKARRPGSIPVVDAAKAAEMAMPLEGFYDLDTWIPTPTPNHVLQSGRAT